MLVWEFDWHTQNKPCCNVCVIKRIIICREKIYDVCFFPENWSKTQLQERAPWVWGGSRRTGDPGRGGQRKAGGSKLRLPTQDTTTGRGNEGDKQQKSSNISTAENVSIIEQQAKKEAGQKKTAKSAECWWRSDDGPVWGLDNGLPAKWSSWGSNCASRQHLYSIEGTSSLTPPTKFDPFAMITGSPLRPGILCRFLPFFAEILGGFAESVYIGHSLWGLCPSQGQGGLGEGPDLAHNTIPTGAELGYSPRLPSCTFLWIAILGRQILYFARFFSYLVSTKGKLRKFRKDTIVTIAGIIKKNPAYWQVGFSLGTIYMGSIKEICPTIAPVE